MRAVEQFMIRDQSISLKCDLLINGLRLNELRRDLVDGQGWNPQRASHFLPAELRLPEQIHCQIRENPEANFRLRIIDHCLIIQDRRSAAVCQADFVQLPAFASAHATDGTAFDKIVVYNGSCNLNFTWNYYCDYFHDKVECRFCNLTPAQGFYPEESITHARKSAVQIGDVVAAARAHHPEPKSILTRGTPRANKGLGETAKILEELSQRFPATNGHDRLRLLLTVSPTSNLSDVKLLHDLGAHSVSFNFEVFDRGYWKAIVPGKDKNIGRELWEESLVDAVRHFGPGKVFSALIAGLEPRLTLLQGIHWLCDRGIVPIVVPFSPETGSQFEGFRPPTHKWMMETMEPAAEIMQTKLPFLATDDYWRKEAPICPECFTGGFLYDVVRSQAGLQHAHCGVDLASSAAERVEAAVA